MTETSNKRPLRVLSKHRRRELKIIELRTNRINQVVEQLAEVQTNLADIEERLVAAKDVHTRTDIIAPLDGTIVDLKMHTVGGVVGPGEVLMDIVPAKAQLIVHARVNPIDIDSLNVGMQAQVVLSAFNRRTVAPVNGTVISISADRLTDTRTGVPYYLARVKLNELPRGDSDRFNTFCRDAGRSNDNYRRANAVSLFIQARRQKFLSRDARRLTLSGFIR